MSANNPWSQRFFIALAMASPGTVIVLPVVNPLNKTKALGSNTWEPSILTAAIVYSWGLFGSESFLSDILTCPIAAKTQKAKRNEKAFWNILKILFARLFYQTFALCLGIR